MIIAAHLISQELRVGNYLLLALVLGFSSFIVRSFHIVDPLFHEQLISSSIVLLFHFPLFNLVVQLLVQLCVSLFSPIFLVNLVKLCLFILPYAILDILLLLFQIQLF